MGCIIDTIVAKDEWERSILYFGAAEVSYGLNYIFNVGSNCSDAASLL